GEQRNTLLGPAEVPEGAGELDRRLTLSRPGEQALNPNDPVDGGLGMLAVTTGRSLGRQQSLLLVVPGRNWQRGGRGVQSQLGHFATYLIDVA
ncbi:hypothetical protein, partial [Actinomadura sp. KC06]|uniref:hypothetical protein n=1 Tax=Actinomadura sp. KC06 TaxID=2530369 RepID=UPI001FB709E8